MHCYYDSTRKVSTWMAVYLSNYSTNYKIMLYDPTDTYMYNRSVNSQSKYSYYHSKTCHLQFYLLYNLSLIILIKSKNNYQYDSNYNNQYTAKNWEYEL